MNTYGVLITTRTNNVSFTVDAPSLAAAAVLTQSAPALLDALTALLAASDLNLDSLEMDTIRAIARARAIVARALGV